MLDVLFALGLKSDLDEVFGLMEGEMREFLMVYLDFVLGLYRLLLLLVVVTHGYMFEKLITPNQTINAIKIIAIPVIGYTPQRP